MSEPTRVAIALVGRAAFGLGLAVLVASVLQACAERAEVGTGARESDVREQIALYDRAWLHKDTTTVAATLAPDYVYLSSTGERWSRERTLELLRSPGYRLTSASRDELQVRAEDGVAVVVSRWRGTGSYEAEAIRDDQRCSMVWVLRDARWRIALEQCTNITAP